MSNDDLFKKIFEYANDAIFIIDPENDKIIDANPSAEKILDYPYESLITMKVSDFHPREMHKFLIFAQTVYEKGYGWTDELTCKTRSNNFLNVEISATVIEFRKIKCLLVMVRDISLRKLIDQSKDMLIAKLQNSLNQVKQLTGLLPVCAKCKKIRSDKGYWSQIEEYIQNYPEAESIRGMCLDCVEEIEYKNES